MKIILNTILFLLILISNVYGKIINIDCKIFISDTNTYEKSWSLDTVKKNYWSKFSDNKINWVEVVMPEDMSNKKYGYTYFEVDRITGNLIVEFSVSVEKPIRKNHRKLDIEDRIFGQCKKGSLEKLF